MFSRHIRARINAALADTPVVFVNGARQTGKTTLVQQIVAEKTSATYLTLDDGATLASAAHDPAGFVQNLAGTAVIDEVQKVPPLFPAIKLAVDRDRRPGRFLLTGSANVLLLPRLSESLAGRMEIISLWPLSQGEIEGAGESFLSRVFSAQTFRGGRFTVPNSALVQRVLRGGFPAAIARKDERRRRDWFGSYLTAVLQHDVRDLAHIEGLTDMPRLLSILASRAGGLLNMSDVSRAVGIPYTTLKRYLALLETTFLIRPVNAWHANLGKRLVKAPKLYLCDSGLLTHLNGIQSAAQLNQSPLKGACVENFVAAELLKQASWSDLAVRLWHFRTAAGRKVDFILESPDGRLAGIEVKASATLRPDDFSALKDLAGHLKQRFVCGVVLYAGDMIVPFGDRLWALPLPTLWKT
jgi:predicted AAA+ superfamily ATPase